MAGCSGFEIGGGGPVGSTPPGIGVDGGGDGVGVLPLVGVPLTGGSSICTGTSCTGSGTTGVSFEVGDVFESIGLVLLDFPGSVPPFGIGMESASSRGSPELPGSLPTVVVSFDGVVPFDAGVDIVGSTMGGGGMEERLERGLVSELLVVIPGSASNGVVGVGVTDGPSVTDSAGSWVDSTTGESTRVPDGTMAMDVVLLPWLTVVVKLRAGFDGEGVGDADPSGGTTGKSDAPGTAAEEEPGAVSVESGKGSMNGCDVSGEPVIRATSESLVKVGGEV